MKSNKQPLWLWAPRLIAAAVMALVAFLKLTGNPGDIELFTQLHYRQSIDDDGTLSDLFRDVFLYHWKEEKIIFLMI